MVALTMTDALSQLICLWCALLGVAATQEDEQYYAPQTFAQ
ncbi:jg25063, partial [Pararge aegeria aegeria]